MRAVSRWRNDGSQKSKQTLIAHLYLQTLTLLFFNSSVPLLPIHYPMTIFIIIVYQTTNSSWKKFNCVKVSFLRIWHNFMFTLDMKIGVLREGKFPPDARVPLSPDQCRRLGDQFDIEVVIQPSAVRCFSNGAYREQGIPLQENLSDCTILLGIKEVPLEQLIPNKTYFFFSHTIKQQAYNRGLLRAILDKGIRLVDYEVLCDQSGERILAFGYFAGMVGAHNAVWAYGKRTGLFELPRMKELEAYNAAQSIYQKLNFPPLKIVITGTGRVGKGAARVLKDMGIREVGQEAYLSQAFDYPVFTLLNHLSYVKRKDGLEITKGHFYQNPQLYESNFGQFARESDLLINGVYWQLGNPPLFSVQEMAAKDFKLQVIADIACDIAPMGAIPSTIRASSIDQPVYGFNPKTREEEPPFQPQVIDMMTVDNLPSEIPGEASIYFGEQLINNVIPELFSPGSLMLEKATIAENGQLGKHFQYLQQFVSGK